MGFSRREVMRTAAGCAALSVFPVGCASGAARGEEDAWRAFSARFVQADGRVVDTGNGGVSHSEGQGYGLILAEAAGDRAAFDRMLDWTRRTLQRQDSGLLTWRYTPGQAPADADPNNATDGDILVAWALLRAQRRWNADAYGQLSETLRAAVLREATVDYGGLHLLLPGREGFVHPDRVELNPAYYVWPALDDFAVQEPLWRPYVADGLTLLNRAAFGRWRLTTDWVSIDAAGQVAPAPGRPPRFGFDAVRVPLYLAWSGRQDQVQPYAHYWRSVENGQGFPAWIDVATNARADYALSPGGTDIADLVLGRPAEMDTVSDADYYSSSLTGLVQLARKAAGVV